jgi:hypothetical protein
MSNHAAASGAFSKLSRIEKYSATKRVKRSASRDGGEPI